MKKYTIYSILILGVIIQTSCKSVQEITMFSDLSNKESLQSYVKEPPEHKIKPFDNLYLSILTLDPEVNKVFNPSMAGNSSTTGTQYMYGSPIGQYINGYRVGIDSTINLPIIGKLNLVGLTLKEAEDKLRATAEIYLQQPAVQVKLLNFRINILGEVKNPGFFYNYEGNTDIIEAIGLANGITPYADLKNVIVNRESNDIVRTYKVDVTTSDIYKSEVFFLQPNDMIYIPPTKLVRTQENKNTYNLLLSTITTLLVVINFIQ